MDGMMDMGISDMNVYFYLSMAVSFQREPADSL
jgi:hypothetical protein